MSEKIKSMYRRAGMKPPKGKGVHTLKFHRAVTKIAKKDGSVDNPFAVAMASLGAGKAVKKSHRRGALRRHLERKRKKNG